MNFLQRTIARVKNVVGSFTTTDNVSAAWLKENGYYRLAAEYGYGNVSQDRALQSTAIYGIIKILGEDTGSLPLFVYRRKGENGRVAATDHPLYDLLHDSPNPETTAMEFREALTAHAALTGNGYARIVRRGDGTILALWQLMPYDVKMDRTERGVLFYRVNERGVEKQYQREDILHVRGFGLDGSAGANLLQVAQSTIGLTLDQADYARKFFQFDRTPGIILEHPETLGPEGIANVKKAWRDAVSSHDVAVTQEGMKANIIGQTNTDAQLVEQRTFQIAEICRLWRMPPHKLGELSRATFSNIEQQNIQYYTETLRPWLVRWEQAISRCLIPAEERKTIFAEHSIEGLLRGDFKTQTDGFARMLEKAVLSVNEVRAFLNFNPVQGGDEHFIQLNMQPLDGAADAIERDVVKPPSAEPAKLRRVKGL